MASRQSILTSKMTHLTTLPYFSHSSFVSPSRSSSTSPRPTMFCKTHVPEIFGMDETPRRCQFFFHNPTAKRRPTTIKGFAKLSFAWKYGYTTHLKRIDFVGIFLGISGEGLTVSRFLLRAAAESRKSYTRFAPKETTRSLSDIIIQS